ncbi:MAG TPA: hypothetical protein VGM56_07570 [Byssovorax sp.]
MSSLASTSRVRLRGARRAAPAVLAALALGCAAGNETSNTGGAEGGGGSALSPPTSVTSASSSSSSSITSSSSASSSASASASTGATGGGGHASGGGGAGGDAAGGAGGANAGGASSTGGGGGAVVQHLVAIAVGADGIEGARYDQGTASWVTTDLGGASTDPPAITFDGDGTACAGVRSTSNGGELDFTLWSAGTWTPLAQLAADQTLSPPSMSGGQGLIDLVFQGAIGQGMNKFFFDRRDTTWSVTDEAVSASGVQSFGPTAAAIARTGADDLLAYTGDDANVYTQVRTNGLWQTAQSHLTVGQAALFSPALVVLPGSTNWLLVFVDGAHAIEFAAHSSAGWTQPVVVAGALSSGTPALAALPSGDAELVYEGQDGFGYAARWSASTGLWAASAPLSSPSVALASPPAIAPGVGSAEAEIAYVASTGVVTHTRLVAGSLGETSQIGSATTFTAVALASQR